MNLTVNLPLGDRVSFKDAFLYQVKIREDILQGKNPSSHAVILCEHPHTITLTRKAKLDNILDKSIVEDKSINFVTDLNRGGDVTYHGPGQLVGYLIFDLREFGRDLSLFLNKIDEVLIKTLAKFRIKGHTRKGFRGAWVGNNKIASIGIGVSRWVSMHGFALNINTDLGFFDKIKPCGLDCRMTSMQKLGYRVNIGSVSTVLIDEICNCFNFNLRLYQTWR